jgi:hypothetical protein
MGTTYDSVLRDAGPHWVDPEFATLVEEQSAADALHSKAQAQRPALCQTQLRKRQRQDYQTTGDLVAAGLMQREEWTSNGSRKRRLLGGGAPAQVTGDVKELAEWQGTSLQNPWLVRTPQRSPWNKWVLASDEEEDIAALPAPHVGGPLTTVGVCSKCFSRVRHHICTSCGVSEFFPEVECGVNGCGKSLYSFHPDCHCIRQPRCREHAFWECTECSTGQALPEPSQFERPPELASVHCSRVITGDGGDEGGRPKSEVVTDILEACDRRLQLARIGWQVLDPETGVLSGRQKQEWAQQVLQSDPELDRRHAGTILGSHESDTSEGAWWRGARVSKADAVVALIGLVGRSTCSAEAVAEWDGTNQKWDSCPSDRQWRTWVVQGRRHMVACNMNSVEWFMSGPGSGLVGLLCNETRWMPPPKSEL